MVQAQLCCYHICFPHKRWTQTHPHLGKYAYVLVAQFTLNDVHTLSHIRRGNLKQEGLIRAYRLSHPGTIYAPICILLTIFVSGLQFLWPWALKELPQVRSRRLTPLQKASSLSLKDMFSTVFLFLVVERPISVPLKRASLPRFGSLYGQVHGGHPNTTVTPNFTAAVEYAFFCPSDSLQSQKLAGTLHSQCTWHWGQFSRILIRTMQATTWLLELIFEFSNLPFTVVVTVVEFHNTIPLIFCSSYWWFCLCNL